MTSSGRWAACCGGGWRETAETATAQFSTFSLPQTVRIQQRTGSADLAATATKRFSTSFSTCVITTGLETACAVHLVT